MSSRFADLYEGMVNPLLQYGLGETITHFPRGNRDSGREITAVVDRGNEETGGGPSDANGRRAISRYLLEVFDPVVIYLGDTFLIDGKIVSYERTIGRGAGSMTISAVFTEADFTKQSRVRQ